MYIAVLLFIVGYALIALEAPLKINKSATAILLAASIWVFYVFAGEGVFDFTGFTENFAHYKAINPDGNFLLFVSQYEMIQHLGSIAEVLFFLMGAMTIVEVIDHHNGFSILTDKIKTNNKRKLLWILTAITFMFSAVLDNLTTTIVMCALLRKIIPKGKERWFYAGMIILAANDGGAWSPIGDVTTIMLWMGGQVTAGNLIYKTIIPCIVSLVVPLTFISFRMKGNFEFPAKNVIKKDHLPDRIKNLVFFLGIGGLLFVPVFKSVTHLPPFIGMLISLAMLWMVTEYLNNHKYPGKESYSCAKILEKIDTSSILFFLGILLAVSGLQSMGFLKMFADGLTNAFDGNIYNMNISIGILSSIIDNVPLIAGAMGMFPLSVFPPDHSFWIFLSYCGGTGGNMLIIGSAAGVAAMGMEKIDFIWYLKKISIWALIGFFAGAGTFILLDKFVF
jgi:Na+/H+ antiporter NhaD/arsenite permease-like protein